MSLLQDDFGGGAELLAAFSQNNEEEFLGLLAMSQAGMFARAAGGWMTITENSRAVIGAMVVPVEDDFLEFFDKLESKKSDPTYKQVMAYSKDETQDTEQE